MKTPTYAFIPVVALLLGLLAPARAVLILEESFNYTAGENVTGQNTGTGFSGAWQVSTVGSGGTGTVASAGLSYGSLNSSGNAWSDANTSTTYANQRPFDGTGLDTNGTSLWFSFMINATANGDPTVSLFTNSNNYTTSGIGARINFSGDQVVARIGSTNGGPGTFDFNLNTTYLIVGRLDLLNGPSGNDTLRLWVNPTTGGSDPTDASALSTSTQVAQTGWFGSTTYLTIRSSGAFSGSIDEIRLGNTFADVTPTAIPEPSTYALLAGGLMTLLWLRRRVRSAS